MIGRMMFWFRRRKLLMAIAAFAGLAGLVYAETGQQVLDVRYVTLDGDIRPIQRDEIYEALLGVREAAHGIAQVKSALERVRWVHHVEVTRHWPDSITVNVVPQTPIAYWNDDAFINDEGTIFVSPYAATAGLAQLYGPRDSEGEVMQQYQQLSRALARSGQTIATLALDERGAWQFTTGQGIRVMLGKDDIMERIQRFLLVVDSAGLSSRMKEIDQIDTRYSNGMAVSWKAATKGLDIAKTDNSERELGI